MELITTHTGADFDALASVVAARKLFPHARAVLPGSPEKAVINFLSLWQDELHLDNEKDIDFNLINSLIIVETRIASRIGRAQELLDKKGLRINIYDHHPRTNYDIKADKDIFKQTGATVTILINILKNRKISITPLEATVMALGIYEDTGSLTFQTTTKLDIDMVGYLFSQGASLNTVSSYLRRELTPKQITFLSSLINKTQNYLINGVPIGVTAIESDGYVEDFPTLVHKLIDIENFNVVFAFAKSDSKIQFVARSSLPYVRVDKIAEAFGGGGHHYAASALIKNSRLDKITEKLFSILKVKIKPKIFAEDIILDSVKSVSVSSSTRETKKLMRKSGVDAVVVYDHNNMVGIITASDIENAAKKDKGTKSVKGYMKRNFIKVSCRTPLYKIQQLVRKEKSGYVAVFKNKRFLGIISRLNIARVTDMDLMSKKDMAKKKRKAHIAPKSISTRIKKGLPNRIFRVLRLIGAIADRENFKVYAVGGFVRDMLLGLKNLDVDVVVEGDGLLFARLLADILRATLIQHKRFGTATIISDWKPISKAGQDSKIEKFKVDIATARTEYYEYPAALPRVSFSSIKQDLYRRDFTINAMAVSLNRKSFGRLIDFFNGQRDLKTKKIRVLHDLSFVEDPTRIFRAVRFEQRYGFMIEPHTEHLIRTAVSLDMFGRTQKQRLRDELILILREARPINAVLRMQRLHELRFIDPGLKLTKKTPLLFDAVDEALSWYRLSFLAKRAVDRWLVYFMAMIDVLNMRQTKQVCEKFVFTKGDEKRIISCKRSANSIMKILDNKKDLLPSQIYKHLEPLSYEVILFIMAKAKTPLAKERISVFFRRYNNVKLSISGKDLKSLSVKPGPRYRVLLDKILCEKLDRRLKGKEDELNFAKKLIAP